jgi:hypothetical protein
MPAWWEGPDDLNVCVLRVQLVTAELWDGPASVVVAAFELAKARLSSRHPVPQPQTVVSGCDIFLG